MNTFLKRVELLQKRQMRAIVRKASSVLFETVSVEDLKVIRRKLK